MWHHREFDNVLDECLERLLTRGGTIEQCLQNFPEHANTLKPLLEIALATKKASAIEPSPEIRDRARHQFYSALRETAHKKSRPFPSWRWQPQWVATVAVVLAFLLAGSGTVAAASGSMPDEPLYPVKLATEQVQLVLTPSTLGKAELYAKLADRRVTEIVNMASESKPEKLERTAQRLDAYLAEIAMLSSTQPARGEAIMAPAAREALTVEKAPAPEVKVAPEKTSNGTKKVRKKADKRTELRETVAGDATENTARLQALLETAPESAKPALLRAIAISKAGYKKALESLEQP
ncbi:DUF5667 domain-containing protein [Chloroflexota bacterium]